MSIYDKASLVLIPSGTKTSKVYSQKPVSGDGDFTFSRSTAATRVNADGNIEKETQNLINYSNTFSTGWVQDRILSATSGQAGYDGTNDAWFVVPTNVVTYHTIRQSSSQTGVVTISVYAKAETYNGILLYSSSNTNGKFFNVSNGTLGDDFGSNVIDATITDVGNGWYRCSVTLNKSGAGNVEVLLSSDGVSTYTFAGDGVGGVYIQDFQIEQGLVARDYIETTTAAVEGGITDNVPRLDYTDSSCPALLLEPQRTNALTFSDYLSGSFWFDNDIIRSQNTTEVLSPEGVYNAVKLTERATTARHRLASNTITTSTSNYTASVFMKMGTARYGFLNVGGVATIVVDLQEGVITDSTTSGAIVHSDIEDYGNGWYRLSVAHSLTAVTTSYLIQFGTAGSAEPTYNNYIPQFLGSTSNNIYVYGAQLEAGSYATSYIPTYGTSVTRNVDKVDGQENASSYNDSEGVLYVEFSALSATRDNEFRFMISDGTNSERLQIGLQTGGDLYASIITGNSATASFNYTLPNPTQNHKIALKYKANDCALWVDGVERGSDTNATMPSGLDIFDFYRTQNNNNFVEANVRETLYFPTALSDEELAALTTI